LVNGALGRAPTHIAKRIAWHDQFFAGIIHLVLPNARIIHTRPRPGRHLPSCFFKPFTAEQNHTYDLGGLLLAALDPADS
jgi:hypothetical protein